jgi:hypothetical protein
MLSTGIKNSVLIVLIILILHFLIKNVLLTKKEPFDSKCTTNTFKPEGGAGSVKVAEVPKPATTIVPGSKDGSKDVYDSWFGDSDAAAVGGSDTDIDKYFAGEIDIKKEIEEATKCTIPVQDPHLPKSSTCDPNFNKVPDDLFKKEVKANCNIVQDKKNILILNEYENESNLNGGKLFMNLDAYDNSESMFAPL